MQLFREGQIFQTRKLVFLVLFLSSCQLAGAQFSLLTYNIRFNNPADGPNAWPYRLERVDSLLRKADPDIMGFQEVLRGQLKELRRRFPDYGNVGVGRDNGKSAGEHSPIFYKKSMFRLLNSGTFWLSKQPEIPGSKDWDAAITRICSWVCLEFKSSGKRLWVFNTHFDHKGATARAESARLMRSRARSMAGDDPHILCGDFNMLPGSDPYGILLEGEQLKDVFMIPGIEHGSETGTFYGFELKGKTGGPRIDYIFISPGLRANRCRIISNHNGKTYPSDHLPFQADLELN